MVHYILYAHLAMFTLHDMLITMLLPYIRDPCFALHMMIDSHTCMCICMLGADIACYCNKHVGCLLTMFVVMKKVFIVDFYHGATCCFWNQDSIYIIDEAFKI